jgi:hypothetical protein
MTGQMRGDMSILKKYVCGMLFFICYSSAHGDHVLEPPNPIVNPINKIPSTIIDFHKNIFCKDTLKIVTAFTPLYLIGRLVDKKIHRCFYCSDHHKNTHQFPKWCYHCSNHGLTAELVTLSAFSFYPFNRDVKITAQVFAISLPFTWVGKKFLKVFKTEACLRPHNQFFNKKKKAYGGCPSGHVMEAMYAATLFGMQLGPWWGVPLGAAAAAIFINFTTANRHFVSQMVAGAGLGVIYASAASKVVDTFKYKDVSYSVYKDATTQGVRMEYDF